MAKILLVSDTHGINDRLIEVVKKEKPFDLLVHCGDLGMTERELMTLADVPVHSVQGNCDYFYDLPPVSVFTFQGHKFFVTHGHNYHVDYGYESLYYRALELEAEYVFFGHTHVPVLKDMDGITIANPGSLSRPRQAGGEPTYMVMDVFEEKKGNIKLKKYSI